MKEKIEKLADHATDAEKVELSTLYNAMVTCVRDYRESPTAANKKNWDAAKAGCEELVSALWEKYFIGPARIKSESLKNRMAAVHWLIDHGYKVKKSKLYKDVTAGLLKMERDGSITMDSLRRYIEHPQAGIKETISQAEAGEDLEIKEYHRRAAIAKMEKAELEAKKLKFELEKDEGLWLARADLEMEMAGRAIILAQGLRNWIQLKVDDWVRLVSGNVSRAQELRAAMNADLDGFFNRYAQADTFQVLFEASAPGEGRELFKDEGMGK